MRKHAWVLLLAALAGVASEGCSTRLRDYRCTPPAVASGTEVDSIWSCNRRIITRAIKGKGFSLREFRHAVAFFEKITGIPADVTPSEQGILPGPRLDQSLAAWDVWFADHAGELREEVGRGSVARPEGGN